MCAVVGVFLAEHASAQYYSWGTDRPMKWSKIRTDAVRLIFPDTARSIAARTLRYIDAARGDIGKGFRYGAMPKMPFVLHAENFESNGLVMYMPLRVEFLTIPSEDNYSSLWLKQLVAHEYRHTVQYNNLNRGVFRALSYLVGQHAPTVSLLCMPAWAMEGDAVMSETAMSTYGRGLQPEFTMGYRAWADRIGTNHRGRMRRNIDRWFCGSYQDYLPDHYELGYQICTYTYTRYGENIWDKVANYGARRPYTIATIHRALRKYYKTNVRTLFHDTFADLQRHWASLPEVEDHSRRIADLPEGNYTRYEHPLAVDRARIVAYKTDFDEVGRWVEVERATGRERMIARTGQLSSRPALRNGRLWWTEYRSSALYEERVHSVLCYMDLADGKCRSLNKLRNVRYATPADGNRIGWIEYRPDGVYELVVNRMGDGRTPRFEITERFAFPMGAEVHGLAWDELTRGWYAILTTDEGMSLVQIENQRIKQITKPAYITLSDLKAGGGQLYFGSIASGRDEAHRFDLLAGSEYQISESRYGGFDPAPAGEGRIVMTAYDHRGYALAEYDREHEVEVGYSPTPRNVVNPERKFWDAVNLDRVRFVPMDSLLQHCIHPPRRYRKGLNLLKLHGWLPVGFDPFEAVDEHEVDLNLGVTLLSQNLLSSTEGFASYGWNQDEGSLWKLGVRYYGLGLAFQGKFTYGGDQIISRLESRKPNTTDEFVKQPAPVAAKHYAVDLSASLPLLYQRGATLRQLSLSVGWNYANSMVADLDAVRWGVDDMELPYIENLSKIGYNKGLHKLSFGAAYASQRRMAYRDLKPRWGWMLKAAYSLNPTNRDFSDLVSAYARAYLPGVARHHALTLAGTYQTALGGYRQSSGARPLTYRSSWLIPRGYSPRVVVPDNYWALSADYELPLWHPEGGVPSVLYIKRIRLNLGADYARFAELNAHRELWSWGADLIFDFNVLRQPASAMSTFRLSVYQPKHGDVWVSGSIGLPF